MAVERKCIVGYKTGLVGGYLYGHRFDILDACCEIFGERFMNTGNSKKAGFNSVDIEFKEGIRFTFYHGELNVMMLGKPIRFCPYCGARIEIRENRKVQLERKAIFGSWELIEKPIT